MQIELRDIFRFVLNTSTQDLLQRFESRKRSVDSMNSLHTRTSALTKRLDLVHKIPSNALSEGLKWAKALTQTIFNTHIQTHKSTETNGNYVSM